MSDQTEILDRFFTELDKSPFLMIGLDETPDHSQPMTAQTLEDERHAVWFFTGRDNRVAMGGPAMAQFMSKGHDFFACLHGTLSDDTNMAMIDRLWSDQVKAWFPDGKDDPNLLLLRFDLESAEMWRAEAGMISAITQMFGGLLGKTGATPDADHAEMTL